MNQNTFEFEPLGTAEVPHGKLSVSRAPIPGGWLVCVGQSVTFVPDPQHAWDGRPLPASNPA